MRTRSALLACAIALAALSSGAGASSTGERDPLRHLQWGLDQAHVPEAWAVTRGAGVTVAVIDSGVDATHPDLRGGLLKGTSIDAPSSQDDCGHGTEVTGVIVARRGNERGIVGVAPESKALPLKDSLGCDVNIPNDIRLIRYAADHGARVINYSTAVDPIAGDVLFDATLKAEFASAVEYAWKRGTLMVAGAGNSSIPLCSATATVPHILCVGSVGKSGQRSSYSQGDATQTADFLMAPGGDNVSLDPAKPVDDDTNIWTTELIAADQGTTVGADGSTAPSGYVETNGTSFAAPFVSGVAALLFSRGLSVQQVHDRLLHCTTDLGLPGRDAVYGYGEVDAAKAVTGKGCA